MRIKLITLSTELNHPGWLKFKASLDHFGYDYHLIHQDAPSGSHIFGTQMPLVYQYLKEQLQGTSYSHVIYCDAWDTIALGPPVEVDRKLKIYFNREIEFLGSAEKACFPHPELAVEYPTCETDWKYVNGGGWLSSIAHFIRMYEANSSKGINDQLWLAQRFIASHRAFEPVYLDYACEIFQTIGFEGPEDFGYADGKPGRLVNFKTQSLPIFMHGNGRTDMSKVWKLFNKDF